MTTTQGVPVYLTGKGQSYQEATFGNVDYSKSPEKIKEERVRSQAAAASATLPGLLSGQNNTVAYGFGINQGGTPGSGTTGQCAGLA